MSQYIENFTDNLSIIGNYGGTAEEDLKDATVHLAWYGYGDYCGSSVVIYEKDGKLYEVNGSHCSCFGLEGQWDPEETSWEALHMRNFYDSYDGSGEANKLLHELTVAHGCS